VSRTAKYPAPLDKRPDVALRIREARLLRNLTQRDLAAEIGCDRVTVTVAESGIRPPTRAILAWLDELEAQS
jgi:transcriptional regulator with XRE-family HTH domain